jgi:hypothetical protein
MAAVDGSLLLLTSPLFLMFSSCWRTCCWRRPSVGGVPSDGGVPSIAGVRGVAGIATFAGVLAIAGVTATVILIVAVVVGIPTFRLLDW